MVEDEYIIALDIAHTLEDAGCDIIGPCEDVACALETIKANRPDCAVLDVQLNDETVHPVAHCLTEMKVPIIFHSGHALPEELTAEFPTASFCSKPCAPQRLVRTVEDATGE
ncbi:response regulator [Sphingomicrobium clamense]|uniref:Response regulator n=1 Tax=Sphingomicrobium clamense TaxID=2851013 RepID=A0ABS6V2C6_9SPHN|nr:response regulator [Sphingomicrobium sp. B8]